MYDHTFYKQVQISRSDIRPHIKWAVSLVILHMITSIFLRALCGYIWVNILTLSPRGEFPQGHAGESATCRENRWKLSLWQFEIHLDSKGLHAAEGRQKVGQLLKCMVRERVATYDAFTWAPAIPAVAANEARGIAAQPEVPAEDKYHLETVFAKFDAHFRVHCYRSIKREDLLSCTCGPKQSVQVLLW